MSLGTLEAVLFDLDGTLVDNMAYHIDAWIEVGRDLGCELPRERWMRDFAGRRNAEILPALLGRPAEPDELERVSTRKEARYRELYAPHLRLLPGADALLRVLRQRGIRLAIATAAPEENRAFVLDGLNLRDRVDAVVGAEEVAQGKPAPDLFLEAARRVGVEPARCLVFEDAVLGIRAALAASMRAWGITTVEPPQALLDAGASTTLENFEGPAYDPDMLQLGG